MAEGRPVAPRLTLASRSAQRRAILEQLGVEFDVVVPEVVELEDGDPAQAALENARRKANAVPGARVLGVDTVVALDGRIYGKPADADAARETLHALSGREHTVISGVCVVERGEPLGAGAGAGAGARERGELQDVRTAVARTGVRFRELDDATIRWYVAREEWSGRAGGYAIQERGAALVAAIDGDYTNVVGLPVATLLDLIPGLLPE